MLDPARALGENAGMSVAADIDGLDQREHAPASAEPQAPAFAELSAELPLIGPAQSASRISWIASLVTALALHAGAILLVEWHGATLDTGNHGIDLEAISVDIVSATAIETVATSAKQAPAATQVPLAVQDGSHNQQVAIVEQTDSKPEPKSEQQPPKAADLVIPNMIVKPEQPLAETPSIIIAPVKVEAIERTIEPDRVADAKPTPQAQVAVTASQSKDAQPAEALGGASARADAPTAVAARAAAAARAGEISEYGVSVHRALLRHAPRLPRGTKATGKVRIEFALTLEGGVDYARVLASSRNNLLDRLALDSVRTAKFDKPPAGFRPEDLRFNIPIQFQ